MKNLHLIFFSGYEIYRSYDITRLVNIILIRLRYEITLFIKNQGMIKDRQLKLDDFYYMDLKTSVKTNFYFMFMMNQMETRFSQSKRFRLYLRNRLSLRPVPICKTNGRTSPFCTYYAHHRNINPDGDIKENRCRIFLIHPVGNDSLVVETIHFKLKN